MQRFRGIGLVLVVLTMSASLEAQSVLYVDDDAAPGGDGLSWATATNNLHFAFDAAMPGDEIRIAQGTYRPAPPSGDREVSFVIPDGIRVYGGYAGLTEPDPDLRDTTLYITLLNGDLNANDDPDAVSLLDPSLADNSVHVVHAPFLSASTLLDGVTISGGNGWVPDIGSARGAGLLLTNSDLEINDCIFEDNFTTDGAGVAAEFGSHLTMTAVTVRGHKHQAVFLIGGSHLVADQCQFVGNHHGSSHGALHIESGTLQLSNCQFLDNSSSTHQATAALDCTAVVATVSDCLFQGNQASEGAALRVNGIHNYERCQFRMNGASSDGGAAWVRGSGPVDFVDCIFEDNTARSGGAIYIQDDLPLRIDGCVFTGNIVQEEGGAIETRSAKASRSGPIVIVNSQFQENSAVRGGALSFGTFLTVANCSFFKNTAESGGAIHVGNTTAEFVNCVLLGNSATNGGGGAIYLHASWSGGVTDLTDCTIVGNLATTRGGGIYVDDESGMLVSNSILWKNAAGEGTVEEAQLVNIQDPLDVLVRFSCLQGLDGYNGHNNTGDDPLLEGPGDDGLWGTPDDDVRLGAGSPCVDAGCNYDVPSDVADVDGDGSVDELLPVDLAGQLRWQDDLDALDTGCGLAPVVDMGAYERDGEVGQLPCPGDLTNDRVIGQQDLGLLLAAYGSSPAGDLDCDGETTQADLAILLSNYATVCD